MYIYYYYWHVPILLFGQPIFLIWVLQIWVCEFGQPIFLILRIWVCEFGQPILLVPRPSILLAIFARIFNCVNKLCTVFGPVANLSIKWAILEMNVFGPVANLSIKWVGHPMLMADFCKSTMGQVVLCQVARGGQPFLSTNENCVGPGACNFWIMR